MGVNSRIGPVHIQGLGGYQENRVQRSWIPGFGSKIGHLDYNPGIYFGKISKFIPLTGYLISSFWIPGAYASGQTYVNGQLL